MRRFETLAISLLATACNGLLGHDSPTLREASVCDDASFDTDPANCGSCGHDCLGGSCSGGTCALVTLASHQNYASFPVIDGPYVYWSNFHLNEIVRIPKDGSCTDAWCVEKVLPKSGVPVASPVRWIAFAGDSLLWSTLNETSAGTIDELDADGGYIHLGTGTWITGNLLDGTDVYAAAVLEPWAIEHMTVGQPGATPVVLLESTDGGAPPAQSIYAMVADASGIWFADYISGNVFLLPRGQTCVLSTTCNAIASVAPKGPVGLAQDATSLYVSDNADSTITRIDKQTHAKTVIATGQKTVQSMWIDGAMLYWGCNGDSTIRAIQRDATTACNTQSCPVLATDQGFPSGFAVDSQAIYWTTQVGPGSPNNEPEGTVVKLAK